MFRKLKALAHRGSLRARHIKLGQLGEGAARDHLVRRLGYRIVAMNVQVPLGRGLDSRKVFGEIDIVAYDRQTLCFVEVKTRRSDVIAPPERNVDLAKQRRIARAARRYRQMMKVTDEPYRFDVVTVIATPEKAKVELMRGYFDDRVFQAGRFFREGFS